MFQTGGFPDLDLSFLFCPFLSFLGLSPDFSGIFPICSVDGPGIFPICPFPLSRPILKSTYEEQSRKGPRHNLDLSRGKHPGLQTPRFSFSQLKLRVMLRPKSLAICGRGWKATKAASIARYGKYRCWASKDL